MEAGCSLQGEAEFDSNAPPKSPKIKPSPTDSVRNGHKSRSGSLRKTVSVASAPDSVRTVESADKELHGQTYARRTWKTTWIRAGPLLGLLSLLLSPIGMFASLGILIASNNAPVVKWQFQPSAYLAVFTARANQGMRFAALQGAVIAWWSGALKGSTISRLHEDWDSGNSIWSALTAGRRTSLLGLACIMSTFVAVDGPLLQKPSTIHSVPIVGQSVALNVTLSPELPRGWSGDWYISYGSHGGGFFNNHVPTAQGSVPDDMFSDYTWQLEEVIKGYDSNRPLTGFIQGCSGSCNAKVRAPALWLANCTNYERPFNYSQISQKGGDDRALNSTSFFVFPDLLVNERDEMVNLVTGYAEATSYDKEGLCAGTLRYRACNLQSAIGEYDVRIVNNSITYSGIGNPVIHTLANNSAVDNSLDQFASYSTPSVGGHNSTLAGIVNIAQILHYAEAGYGVLPRNKIATFSYNGSPDVFKYLHTRNESKCLAFSDPADGSLRSLNQIMFHAGVIAAKDEMAMKTGLDPGLESRTTVTGHVQGHHNVYKSNFWWFVGAILAETLCIALVLPTYMGWWRLGRPVSFSPLEIAKAFDAPLFAGCNSNSSGRDIAEAVGRTNMRYGAIDNTDAQAAGKYNSRKLAFSDSGNVYRPMETFHFTN